MRSRRYVFFLGAVLLSGKYHVSCIRTRENAFSDVLHGPQHLKLIARAVLPRPCSHLFRQESDAELDARIAGVSPLGCAALVHLGIE